MILTGYPDAIVCYTAGSTQWNVYNISMNYDDGVDQVTQYEFQSSVLQYGTGGVYSGGATGSDCENVNLPDITIGTTTTPYGVNYGDTLVVQPSGLSTDPVIAVLLATFLVIYTANYVRRVFFT